MPNFPNLSLRLWHGHNLFLNQTCMVCSRYIPVFLSTRPACTGLVPGIWHAKKHILEIYHGHDKKFRHPWDICNIFWSSVTYTKALMYFPGIYLWYLYVKYVHKVYRWYIPTPTFFYVSSRIRQWYRKSCAGPAAPEPPTMVSVCLVLQNLEMGESKGESSQR